MEVDSIRDDFTVKHDFDKVCCMADVGSELEEVLMKDADRCIKNYAVMALFS